MDDTVQEKNDCLKLVSRIDTNPTRMERIFNRRRRQHTRSEHSTFVAIYLYIYI